VFKYIREALKRRAIFNRTINELSKLSDRELSDLGFNRSMIISIAHETSRDIKC